MFTHCVFFWLKDGASTNEIADFERGLSTLPGIPGVLHGTFGVPAPSERPVVESSYSYALMLRFHDSAAHDAYQIHRIHQAFLEGCSKYWTKVVVYDFIPPPEL
jgi:hypothetical protein